MRVAPRIAIVTFIVVVSGSLLPAASGVGGTRARGRPSDATACAPTWRPTPTPDPSGSSTLFGVDARTANDVWTVGAQSSGASFDTLVEHWDGTRWRIVRSPNPVSDENVLTGVSAIAGDDVWAVGRIGVPFVERVRPLIEHYDGTSWKIVQAPLLPGETFLSAVLGIGPDDVWAAGFNSTPRSPRRALVLHWDGAAWSVADVPPDPGVNNYLFALGGTGRRDVWTVGANFHGSGEPTTIHWDGRAWTRVPFTTKVSSDSLHSLAAAAADDVWAGGTRGLYGNDEALMSHWDGAAWSLVRFPQLGKGFGEEGDGPVNEIDGMSLSSPDDVWAVGQFMSWPTPSASGPPTAFVGHWDGTSWQAWAREPDVTPHQITAVPSGRAWSVGERSDAAGFHAVVERICPMIVSTTGYTPTDTTITVGETLAWKVGPDVAGPVSIRDTLGLVDSGPRSPSGSFTQRFSASGTYQLVTPSPNGAAAVSATVGVSPTIHQLLPSLAPRFLVRWGTSEAPSGYVFDVQIERPDAAGFVDWQTGTLLQAGDFVQDAGPGTYAFRARLRRTDGTGATPYSPPIEIAID